MNGRDSATTTSQAERLADARDVSAEGLARARCAQLEFEEQDAEAGEHGRAREAHALAAELHRSIGSGLQETQEVSGRTENLRAATCHQAAAAVHELAQALTEERDVALVESLGGLDTRFGLTAVALQLSRLADQVTRAIPGLAPLPGSNR